MNNNIFGIIAIVVLLITLILAFLPKILHKLGVVARYQLSQVV